MNGKKIWIANFDIVLREEMDDWALLFDPGTGQVVGVNPVGAAIWKLLDGKHSIDMIIHSIQQEFSGSPESIAKDVDTFIDQLIERGFIGKAIS